MNQKREDEKMTDIKKHLNLFPERIRNALLGFANWSEISEIRVRRDLPLSLTGFSGNLFLSPQGKACKAEQALTTSSQEIRFLISSFCRGNMYRYFDTFKDGYLVDEDGYRLSVLPQKGSSNSLLPEAFEGASLRLARRIKGASNEFLKLFPEKKPISTLIVSPPGGGKTTLLRDLATVLSRGERGFLPMRVAVIDEKNEIFPSSMIKGAGLCDHLCGYPKAEGITLATRLLSPQIILCDEIGTSEEGEALLSALHCGCTFYASAHGESRRDVERRPFLKKLIDFGAFDALVVMTPIAGKIFQVKMERWNLI